MPDASMSTGEAHSLSAYCRHTQASGNRAGDRSHRCHARRPASSSTTVSDRTECAIGGGARFLAANPVMVPCRKKHVGVDVCIEIFQISVRKIDGWQALAAKRNGLSVDVAA